MAPTQERDEGARSRTRAERVLVFLLRLGGCLTLSAAAAMVLPTSWMAAIHRSLGLGEFPESPLVDYLTRSISALYAFHGGMLLVAASDVRRYRGLVVYVAFGIIALGAALLAIDLNAGMPPAWTLTEGPPTAAMGFLMLYLLRSVPAE